MDEQFDTQAFLTRAQLVEQQIRRSEAYPALLGGIAGGIAGALMAAMIAGRIAARREQAAPRERASPKSAWSARELIQLVTVAAPLLKQIQAWVSTNKKRMNE